VTATRGHASNPGWAVVVGVNTYQDASRFKPLTGSVFDAIAMYAFLTHAPYTALRPDQCRLFLSGTRREVMNEAERVEQQLIKVHGFRPRPDFVQEVGRRHEAPDFTTVQDAVEHVSAKVRHDELLVMYVSSHGESTDDGRFIVLADTRSGVLRTTALSVPGVLQRMAASATSQRVLLLDTCDSGAVRTTSAPVRKSVIDPDCGVAVLAAAVAERSLEVTGIDGTYGLFTRFLCQGLAGAAGADGRGWITVADLTDYVLDAAAVWRANNSALAGRGPVLNLAGQRIGHSIVLAGGFRLRRLLRDRRVSRRRELDLLRKRYGERATSLALVGEPGAGKTWIARVFASQPGLFDALIEVDCRTAAPVWAKVRRKLENQVWQMSEHPDGWRLLVLLDGVADHSLPRHIEARILDHGLAARFQLTLLVTSTLTGLQFQRPHIADRDCVTVRDFNRKGAEALLATRVPSKVRSPAGRHALAVAERFGFVAAVVHEIGEWLAADHGRRAEIRVRLVPAALSKSHEHVETALRAVPAPERRLLDAAAVCGARRFSWSVACELAGETGGGELRDALVGRSLLREVDRDAQLFRLPPLVRATLRRDGRLNDLRRRHALLVHDVLDRGLPPTSNHPIEGLAQVRSVLLEVPVALRWLHRERDTARMIALLMVARAALGSRSIAERALEELLVQVARTAEWDKAASPVAAEAPHVCARVLWSRAFGHRADGNAAAGCQALEALLTLQRALEERWREPECHAVLAQLALGDGKAEDARESLARCEEICRATQDWQELARCLGDQVVLAFASDTEPVPRGFEEDALRCAAVLLDRQYEVAARLRRPDCLPSQLGNLAVFREAVCAWQKGHIAMPAVAEDWPTRLVRNGHPLAARLWSFLVALLAGGHHRQFSAVLGVYEVNAAPDMLGVERDPLVQVHGAGLAASTGSWGEIRQAGGAAVADIPVQHVRFRSVQQRLLRAWVHGRPSDSEQIFNKALQRYYASGAVTDLQSVIAILEARDRHDEAVKLLGDHATGAEGMKDVVSWLVAVARQEEIVASAIDRAERAPAGRPSAPDRKRLAEFRRTRPQLAAKADALAIELTFGALAGYQMWAWGMLAACLGDRSGATNALQQVGELFEELRFRDEARLVADDRRRLRGPSRLARAASRLH
jgi:hypothetical protein